ncbi:MAG: NUDIX hydrolase [Chloroflexi bacterium]|nr:NUDIX hydrolase [Chloroflexota bacterium]
MAQEPPVNDRPLCYCPYCGNPVEYQQRYGLDRAVCPACGWIHFQDPKVAVATLIFQDSQVLLTRRVNEPYRGCWTLPAGFVNAHEDPAEAAVRECLEETGLHVQITALEGVIGGREHAAGADILIAYRAVVISGVLQAGDDADQAGFFPLDHLPPLAFKTTSRLLGQG